MNNDNSLMHYGVKGMQWGKRKKSYYDDSGVSSFYDYDGSGSPFSKFRRTIQKVYYDKDGRVQTVNTIAGGRPKTSKTGYHNHGGNKPLQKGKGLYKKGSGLGTGPVGPGYSKNNYSKGKATNNGPNGSMTRSNNDSSNSNKPMGINEWGYGPYHSYTVVGSSAVGPQVGDRNIRKREKAIANKNIKNLNTVLRQKFNVKNRPIKNAINKGKSVIQSKIKKSNKPNLQSVEKKAVSANSKNNLAVLKRKATTSFKGTTLNRVGNSVKKANANRHVGQIRSYAQGQKNMHSVSGTLRTAYNKAHLKKSYNTIQSRLKNPVVYKVKKRLGFW